MALLPYPVVETLEDERIRNLLLHIPALNLIRMEGHAEGIVESIVRLSDSVLNRSRAPANLRLTAFIRLCEVVGSPYEFEQLAKVARNFQISEAKIAAAREGSASAGLTEQERQAARLAEELAARPKASPATIEALATFLTTREVVELIMGVGFYLMQSRVIETLELEIENPPVVLPPPQDSEHMNRWRNGMGAI